MPNCQATVENVDQEERSFWIKCLFKTMLNISIIISWGLHISLFSLADVTHRRFEKSIGERWLTLPVTDASNDLTMSLSKLYGAEYCLNCLHVTTIVSMIHDFASSMVSIRYHLATLYIRVQNSILPGLEIVSYRFDILIISG